MGGRWTAVGRLVVDGDRPCSSAIMERLQQARLGDWTLVGVHDSGPAYVRGQQVCQRPYEGINQSRVWSSHVLKVEDSVGLLAHHDMPARKPAVVQLVQSTPGSAGGMATGCQCCGGSSRPCSEWSSLGGLCEGE